MQETTTIHAKYAIFLPVRNGADYVRQAIQSILGQTQADWALIVLDNQSTDGTLAIAQSFADSRISIVPADRDLSIWENWSRAHALLSGGRVHAQYITFLGHDDYLYPHFLDVIESLIQAHPNAGVYQTHFDLVGHDGAHLRACRPIPSIESGIDFLLARCWGIRDSFGTGYVFPMACFLDAGGLQNFPRLLCADDFLVLSALRAAHKVCDTRPCFAYRRHRASASGAVTPAKVSDQIHAYSAYLKRLQDEFPHWVGSAYAQWALSFLVCREVLVFDSIMLRWMLSPEDRAILKSLRKTAQDLRDSHVCGGYPGITGMTGRLLFLARRLHYFQLMVRGGAR